MNFFTDLPLYIWGAVCLGIALVYTIIWPKPARDRTVPRPRWMHLILRWANPAVWVLVGISCFLRALWPGLPMVIPNVAALAGLVLYVVFIAGYIADRLAVQREKNTASRKAAAAQK
jgi:hypothetical protein